MLRITFHQLLQSILSRLRSSRLLILLRELKQDLAATLLRESLRQIFDLPEPTGTGGIVLIGLRKQLLHVVPLLCCPAESLEIVLHHFREFAASIATRNERDATEQIAPARLLRQVIDQQ